MQTVTVPGPINAAAIKVPGPMLVNHLNIEIVLLTSVNIRNITSEITLPLTLHPLSQLLVMSQS